MDPQFDPNMTTWYVIFPMALIGLGLLVWFIVKMKTTIGKRIALSIISLFAFFGFISGVLAVYYQFNEPFAAMFKFYAYSKFAPDDDPFVQADDENRITRVLGVTEVTKKGGQVIVAQPPVSLGFDYGAYIFTPNKWQAVKIDDHTMTLQDIDNNGQPDIIHTSLWWALTNDPYTFTVDANKISQ